MWKENTSRDLPPAGCWLVVWLQFGSFSSLLWLIQLMIFSPPSPNRTVPNPIFDLRYFWGWNWLCERLTDKHHAGAVYYHHLVFSTALSLLSFKIRILCVLWSMSLLFFFQEFFFFFEFLLSYFFIILKWMENLLN